LPPFTLTGKLNMKTPILILLNLGLIASFVFILRKQGLLSYYSKGRWWLTWLSVAIITLMDELTSVFYAPAEAYRFIGLSALFFIPFTSIFIHYMTTRLVEIAEILEHHKLIGGGVYSFSYLVLGPVFSFVAVASIMVDYILTACLSAVSAVLNTGSFFTLSQPTMLVCVLVIIWGVAGLNILGIRENARFTFAVFVFAMCIFANLIVSGVLALDGGSIGRLNDAAGFTAARFRDGSIFQHYEIFIASVASCILAYSGVESVLQTAGLVRNWRDIGKAYIFLACTVGLITPIVAGLALLSPVEFKAHEGDLITSYATMVNGNWFGIAVGTLASFALIMAVNTAFVASSELMERVAHRYGFHWISATNKQQSLYRIHTLNAVFFSLIIFITQGSQMLLADMYALGLIASFCLNMGALIIYRYTMGTKEVLQFNTSRLITLIMWIIFMSCFVFLAINKPHGTMLWASVTGVVLISGVLIARKRAPELREIEKTDSEMDIILHLAQSSSQTVHIYFRRPQEEHLEQGRDDEVFVTFFSPRQGIPHKMLPNHYRLPLVQTDIYDRIVALLKVVEYELSEHHINIHLGWPMSSWLDRFSIGVMVFKLMRLPRHFPRFIFTMSYLPQPLPAPKN